MKRFCCWLPLWLLTILRSASRASGKPQSTILREALMRHPDIERLTL